MCLNKYVNCDNDIMYDEYNDQYTVEDNYQAMLINEYLNQKNTSDQI